MKRMWSVLGAGLIAGAVVTPLISCNVIHGDTELLVDDPDHPVHSPRWSSDGSKIYFILGKQNDDPWAIGSVWSFNLSDNTQTQITEEEIWDFDILATGNLAVTWEAYWFWIRDLETWDVLDSIKPCEEAMEVWVFIDQPKFSYESEELLYYTYWVAPDSIHLHRMDLADLADEEILFSKGEKRIFAPGPGDTLIALNDTVYNLTTGEQIPIPIKTGLKELQWNPVVPAELLISLGDNGLFLFNLVERKTYRIEINTPKGYDIVDARFSPDGESIVLLASWNGDGFFENQIWLFKPLD